MTTLIINFDYLVSFINGYKRKSICRIIHVMFRSIEKETHFSIGVRKLADFYQDRLSVLLFNGLISTESCLAPNSYTYYTYIYVHLDMTMRVYKFEYIYILCISTYPCLCIYIWIFVCFWVYIYIYIYIYIHIHSYIYMPIKLYAYYLCIYICSGYDSKLYQMVRLQSSVAPGVAVPSWATKTVLSPWLAADEARVSHVLSHVVW